MTKDEQALTQAIGQRLRALRHERQLSLQQLADLTDGVLSKSRISNYEQGIRRLGVEPAQALSKALTGVSAAYLLCLDDGERPPSNDEWELLQAFRNTDDRGRQTMLTIASQQSGSA
jgi:transcriptional regulator with XRE-family HTH domain